MIPAAIVGLMKDTVTVKTLVTTDAYGNPVYSTGETMKAYVDYRNRMIRTVNGDDDTSDCQVYLSKDVPGLTVQGQIVLPNGIAPPIKDVRRPAWPDGSRHVEVFL